jgi:hypothetical protein
VDFSPYKFGFHYKEDISVLEQVLLVKEINRPTAGTRSTFTFTQVSTHCRIWHLLQLVQIGLDSVKRALMAIRVFIHLEGSSAIYDVKHEIDGIYKAVLTSKPHQLPHLYPQKVILIRSGDKWTSDCPTKELVSKIGEKIEEQERLS